MWPLLKESSCWVSAVTLVFFAGVVVIFARAGGTANARA
jgi:hypothetical protein